MITPSAYISLRKQTIGSLIRNPIKNFTTKIIKTSNRKLDKKLIPKFDEDLDKKCNAILMNN